MLLFFLRSSLDMRIMVFQSRKCKREQSCVDSLPSVKAEILNSLNQLF